MPDARLQKKANTDLLEFLDHRWKKLRKNWRLAHREISPDILHDVRVSVRRFMSVIEVYRHVDHTIRSKKLQHWLKSALKTSSRLRDLQVEKSSITEQAAENRKLKEFQVFISTKESKETGKLEKAWRKRQKIPSEASALKKEIRKIIRNHPRLKLRRDFVRAVDDGHRNIMRQIDAVDPDDRKSIHRVRVALKQFRYVTEVAHPLLGTRLKSGLLNQIGETQSEMGKIQDLEVLLNDLNRWSHKNPERAVAPLIAQLSEKRQQAVADFMASRGKIASFWKRSSKN